MITADIIVLVLSIILAIGVGVLIKFMANKLNFKVGIWWIVPISLPLGWMLQHETCDGDTVFKVLWDSLVWAFVISMIVVNIKFLVLGGRNGFTRSKAMFKDLKESLSDMRSGIDFKNKKTMTDNETDVQNSETENNSTEEGDVSDETG